MIQLYTVYKKHILDSKTHILRVKGWKLICHGNNNQKNAGVTILISGKKTPLIQIFLLEVIFYNVRRAIP